MAGTIYFLADLLQPAKARFPAFEVWNLPWFRLPWIRLVTALPVALSLLLDVNVFLSFFYYYGTKFHKSQRWEVFCFFGFIFALCPQKWQKSHFHTVKNQMHDGRSLCCVKLLRLIKKKRVLQSLLCCVHFVWNAHSHRVASRGQQRGRFPQPIKFNKCI